MRRIWTEEIIIEIECLPQEAPAIAAWLAQLQLTAPPPLAMLPELGTVEVEEERPRPRRALVPVRTSRR
jgi:hypothetical protein